LWIIQGIIFAGANSKCIDVEASTAMVIRAIFLLEVMEIGILLSAFSTFITLQYYFIIWRRRAIRKAGSILGRRSS
jgi:hypothetical protein